MRALPAGIFRTLRRLTVLHLSSNKLERLDDVLLRGLIQLEDVDLSRNELSEVPPLLFDGNQQLIYAEDCVSNLGTEHDYFGHAMPISNDTILH